MALPKKLENAALFLPLFGIIIIIPPLIHVFSVEVTVFGIPLIVIYIFVIWATLIGTTFFLSNKMSVEGDDTDHSKDSGKTL